MDMLQQILDVDATLIDYERVIDEKGRRLIFFGNWAGMAGISDTFRVLGERLESKGIKPKRLMLGYEDDNFSFSIEHD